MAATENFDELQEVLEGLQTTLDRLPGELAGAQSEDAIQAIADRVAAEAVADPEALIEKWSGEVTFTEAVELETGQRVATMPAREGVHVEAPLTPETLEQVDQCAEQYGQCLDAWDLGEFDEVEFPAIEPEFFQTVERRAWQLRRKRRNERRPNTPRASAVRQIRPQGRASRQARNARSRGSRRASSASSGGGDPGEPGDPDPSGQGQAERANETGHFCEGCGAYLEGRNRDTRFCADRCRKAFHRRGKIPAKPVGTFRRPELVRDEYLDLAERRQALWREPNAAERRAELAVQMAKTSAAYRLARAARVRGLV